MRETNLIRAGICKKLQSRLSGFCARIGDRAGSAIVELALVVPIFAALLLGAAELAMVEYAAIETTNAARAGVAYGSATAASTLSAAQITAMQTAATNDGANVSGLTATGTQFWSCSNTPSTQNTSSPTCTSGNSVLHYVQVTTSATVTPVVHFSGLPVSYTITGTAIMRVL